AEYRQEVLATCHALPRGQPSGLRFEQEPHLLYFRTQRKSWQSTLDGLWEEKAPDSLQDEKQAAKDAAARFLDSWGAALDTLEQELPESFDRDTAQQYAAKAQATLAEPTSSWLRAMAKLAGEECTPVQS